MGEVVAGGVLRSVLDEGSLGVAVFRPLDRGSDYVVVYANAVFRALRPGVPPLVGRSFSDVWPEVAPRYLEVARRVLESGEPWVERDVPLRAERLPDPAVTLYHTVEISRRFVADRPYLVAVVRETSSEQARRQSGLLDELLKQGRDGLFMLDGQWRYMLVNDSALQDLGLTREEVTGLTFWELRPGPAGGAQEQAYRAAMTEGHAAVFEVCWDGDAAWSEVHISPTIEGLLVWYADISDRKRIETRLRSSEERLRSATSLPSVELAELDEDLRYAWVHSSREDEDTTRLIGKRGDEADESKDARRLTELHRLALERGELVQAEWCADRPDGRHCYDVYLQSRRDDKGRVVGLMSAKVDITQHKRVEEELVLSKRVLEAHVDNSPLAVVEFDGDMRVTRWSDEAARLFGWQASEVVGKAVTDLTWLHEADDDAVWLKADDLRRGSVTRNVSANRNYRKDGSALWCEWYNSSIYDDDGRLVSLLSQVQDITEQRLSMRLRDAIAHIDRTLHSTLDQRQVMASAVTAGAEALGADTASLCLLDEGRLVVANVYNLPEDTVGMAIPGVGGRQMQALKERHAVAIHASSTESAATARHMKEWGVASMISLPLVVRDQPLGVLYLNYTDREREFGEAEMTFAERLNSSLSLALENARLYEVEHRIAQTLQETLLVAPSRVPGVNYARAYEAASGEMGKVGGDFVDIFEARGHLVAVTLGDVSGKGLDAAVMTSFIRNTLRVHALDGLPADTVMARTNEVAVRFTEKESFATAFFGLLDTRSGVLRYVSAGHPPGIVLSRDGRTRELTARASVLGVFEGATFPRGRDVLIPGDRLVLYSDGVSEACSPEHVFLGDDLLIETLRSLAAASTEELCAALLKKVVDFSRGALRDDAAVLVVEPTALRSREGGAQLSL